MLARGTQTIINQVQAMKRMVDDFRDYARCRRRKWRRLISMD
jgi:nitrogen fixation/metabolism regulation signal transduction histidine kinase